MIIKFLFDIELYIKFYVIVYLMVSINELYITFCCNETGYLLLNYRNWLELHNSLKLCK